MTATEKRIRKILRALPEVELEVGGDRDQHVGASVRKKRFAYYLDDHHGDGIVGITCKAAAGENVGMIAADPDHCYLPSYTGARGWVGIRLDTKDVDWELVKECLAEAYRLTAPKSLIAQLEKD